jgi:DNA-binding LacI/PurR family transcriptional regulator
MARAPRSRGADVTIRDIADELGMSHATVSRALHDHAAISAPTKARVHEAAQRLGYIPNSGARALRQVHSRLIGVIFPDIENDFYSAVMNRLSRAMREAHYELVLAVSHDVADIEAQHVRSLREARVAGVIIAPSTCLHASTAQLLAPLPVVQLLRRHPLLAGPVVGIDELLGIARGVVYLASRGHRRIAYVGGPVALSTGLDRLAGYRDGLLKAGITFDESLVMLGDPRPEFGRAAIELLLQADDPPTAVLFAGSQLTLGGLSAIRRLDLQVPRDLAVLGYHDPAWFAVWGNGISAIRLPVDALATHAGATLLAMLQGGPLPAELGPARLEPRLVLRGSTRTRGPNGVISSD